ncbi:MAG: type II secretion system GspH family protein [Fimbriimonadaceae bacterium]|nr:type II secretion system GspH family protein [Fimbriimonadaceae bacterium]
MARQRPKTPYRRSRRAFTLLEVLVATTIVAVLAALLFSVFGYAMESAKRTTCLSNLHQLGLALESYRSDWDDRKPVDSIDMNGRPIERQAWISLEPYVKSREPFQCPEDPRRVYERAGYIYRAFVPDVAHPAYRIPLGTAPSSMSVWCMYHLTHEVVHAPYGDYDDPVLGSDGHYEGTFVFLRNDTSASRVNAKGVDTYVSDGTNWYVLGAEPSGFKGTIRTQRFPGEPWPPEFQR